MTNTQREIRVYDQLKVELVVRDENGLLVDLSQAVLVTLKIRKPNGVLLERAISYKTDGTDGIILYQFGENEIDMKGLWKLQLYLELGSGIRRSTIIPFEVYPNLD